MPAEGEEIGYVHPSYSYYATLAEIQGARVRTFGLTDDFLIAGFPERYEGKIFFLTTPNAPLGFGFPFGLHRVAGAALRRDAGA